MIRAMQNILRRLSELDPGSSAQAGEQCLRIFRELIDAIRPPRRSGVDTAVSALRALSFLISQNPDLRAGLQRGLNALFSERPAQSLLTGAGILPSTGFFSEASRRIGHTLLPEVVDNAQLRGVLCRLFPFKGDAEWVGSVEDTVWIECLNSLYPADADASDTPPLPNTELLQAMCTLSYWIAASGLEAELVRLEPNLSRYESPFVALNGETLAFIAASNSGDASDDSHLHVLIAQCHDWLNRIRRQAMRFGTSIPLTFRVRRLRQLLQRLGRLLDANLALQTPIAAGRDWRPLIALFKRLVKAECLRNDLGTYWRQHLSLLALRITENAGKAGEHYITSGRSEYFALLRSALGAGIIIAAMALSKTLLSKLNLAPLIESLAFCLNYGLGFVLIHLLHGTVATKQPAMTANAIAASLGESKGKLTDLANLVDLIARTVRSQIAAIVGNICFAIPTAVLLASLFPLLFGSTPYDVDKAAHLLAEVQPLHSLALFYAAIAGACLFLAGLISGYFDNLAAYDDIPARIAQLPWARRIFGEARMRRVAIYIGDNLGALAGNFFFGFLLGGAGTLGILVGLPLDIRHVAFSSANLGFALVGSDFAPNWELFAWASFGVLLIGAMNLAVSFALALFVALRSRRISFAATPRLIATLAKHFLQHPGHFFLPPKNSPQP